MQDFGAVVYLTTAFLENLVSQNAPPLWAAPRRPSAGPAGWAAGHEIKAAPPSAPHFGLAPSLPPAGVTGPGRHERKEAVPRSHPRAAFLRCPHPLAPPPRLWRVSRRLPAQGGEPGPHPGRQASGPPRLRAGAYLGGNITGRGLGCAEIGIRRCGWGAAGESRNPGGAREWTEAQQEAPGARPGRSGRGRGGGEGPSGARLGRRVRPPRPGTSPGGERRGGERDPRVLRSRDRPLALQGGGRAPKKAGAASAA
ncbi:translation initiation factor IF-2-like [Cervus elaphus]|uniref:translation initiation factor IF-2-like n=1 Tax=Cervus elaphus TaxID=9860 RepID=UPI001CC2F0FB|nr:translation initiation factor IF-2-like [Cervus elaphus]